MSFVSVDCCGDLMDLWGDKESSLNGQHCSTLFINGSYWSKNYSWITFTARVTIIWKHLTIHLTHLSICRMGTGDDEGTNVDWNVNARDVSVGGNGGTSVILPSAFIGDASVVIIFRLVDPFKAVATSSTKERLAGLTIHEQPLTNSTLSIWNARKTLSTSMGQSQQWHDIKQRLQEISSVYQITSIGRGTNALRCLSS